GQSELARGWSGPQRACPVGRNTPRPGGRSRSQARTARDRIRGARGPGPAQTGPNVEPARIRAIEPAGLGTKGSAKAMDTGVFHPIRGDFATPLPSLMHASGVVDLLDDLAAEHLLDQGHTGEHRLAARVGVTFGVDLVGLVHRLWWWRDIAGRGP